MLDAYIIEEIKRQEDEKRRREDAARPRLRIEIPDRTRREAPETEEKDGDDKEGDEKERPEPESGVIRIDLRA